MTPGRTPGYATPGHISVRHATRTPNPYPGPIPSAIPQPMPGSSVYGGASAYGVAPNAFGYQTPRSGGYPAGIPGAHNYAASQPAGPPPGMNAGRAAMIQNTGGGAANWRNGGGWR